MSSGTSCEALLNDVLALCDDLFDHLSVLQQFDEVTSRGARADDHLRVEAPGVLAQLLAARDRLRDARMEAHALCTEFVAHQLAAKRFIDNGELRLHLGSAGHPIPGWVNIDAGGGDLSLNVNWGLPFADGSANFVYAAHVLEHLRYSDQAPVLVREVHRVLRPGGVVRIVVPDVARLLEAYVTRDADFFAARQRVYPLSEGFLVDGIASLDYILLFCGANAQTLNYNHKFGYDEASLSALFLDAGFRTATRVSYQVTDHPALRVDDHGYNARAESQLGEHFSLFLEAVK